MASVAVVDAPPIERLWLAFPTQVPGAKTEKVRLD
jgi:hypothetical protein